MLLMMTGSLLFLFFLHIEYDFFGFGCIKIEKVISALMRDKTYCICTLFFIVITNQSNAELSAYFILQFSELNDRALEKLTRHILVGLQCL